MIPARRDHRLFKRMRKIARILHLWLGLLTGLVVFVIAVTGALYCFAPELQDATQSYRTVTPQERPFLPPARIRAIAERELPGRSPQRIYYGSPERSVMVLFRTKGGPSWSVFIDPYTG